MSHQALGREIASALTHTFAGTTKLWDAALGTELGVLSTDDFRANSLCDKLLGTGHTRRQTLRSRTTVGSNARGYN